MANPKTSEGRIDLGMPRDRSGLFELQIVKKHQTSASDEDVFKQTYKAMKKVMSEEVVAKR